MKIPVFVINLPSSTDRRVAVERQLALVGATAQFFPAIPGSFAKQQLPNNIRSSQLTDGELGCYLSHVELWKKTAALPGWGAIILEDDVTLSNDFVSTCEELLSVPLCFDVIRLGSLRVASGKTLWTLSSGRQLLLPSDAPDGTQGYLLSRAGAKRLLERIASPRSPIDRELNQYWEHDLRVLLLAPGVVKHDVSLASTISPSGRVPIRTSLPLLQRIRRSLKKRAALRRIKKSILQA